MLVLNTDLVFSSPRTMMFSAGRYNRWFFFMSKASSVQIFGLSAPGVKAMFDVVVLQLDLVFDLIDQNLRQEDANQLQRRDKTVGLTAHL